MAFLCEWLQRECVPRIVNVCEHRLHTFGVFSLQETLIKLQEERIRTGAAVGLDVQTGQPMLPDQRGIWDNVKVKRQCLTLSTILASQLLLVDEVLRAGRGSRGG
jgi:chaperonin GroEL (HSP60 family)